MEKKLGLKVCQRLQHMGLLLTISEGHVYTLLVVRTGILVVRFVRSYTSFAGI